MSWDMWHIEGYGFPTGRISGENLFDFMEKHESSLCKDDKDLLDEIRKEIRTGKVKKEDLDAYEDFAEKTESMTVAEIISAVIKKETGIRMDAVGVTGEGDEAVILCPRMPWGNNEAEASLKCEEDLQKICKPFMDDLKVDEWGWQDLVFSG